VHFSDEQRLLAQTSPAGLAVVTGRGKWKLARHLDFIDEVIIDAVSGRGPRHVVIHCPPRHGKSELISHRIRRRGIWGCSLISRSCSPATRPLRETWGRKAATCSKSTAGLYNGVQVRTDARAQERWYTDQGGVMAASGIGGRFTGMGADLLIIDDPIKNAEEARSSYDPRQADRLVAEHRRHPPAPGAS
jgi:hypothetical protein